MATTNEIAAFEDFRFRVGQKVRSKFAGNDWGYVIARLLTEDVRGVGREYIVRHSALADRTRSYYEHELDEQV